MNRHQRREAKCTWPNCSEQNDQPFADGWGVYSKPDVPFLPEHGFLCPTHGQTFEGLAVGEPPPTNSAH